MRSHPQQRMLGMVTIGQSPRDDIMPQMRPFLPDDLAIRQVGALDGLSHEQLVPLAPGPHDYQLHSRLRDGSPVTVGRERIMPLVQAGIRQLEEEGASAILLLCTGEFPELQSKVLLIEPDRLLLNVVRGLGVRRVGIFVPLPSQIEALAEKWRSLEVTATLVAASPYKDPAEVGRAAAELGRSLELVIMDCMGYTQAHKQLVAQAIDRPVILAAGVVARIVGALVGL
jgi:protein AroM